jgi:hypothetical protein
MSGSMSMWCRMCMLWVGVRWYSMHALISMSMFISALSYSHFGEETEPGGRSTAQSSTSDVLVWLGCLPDRKGCDGNPLSLARAACAPKARMPLAFALCAARTAATPRWAHARVTRAPSATACAHLGAVRSRTNRSRSRTAGASVSESIDALQWRSAGWPSRTLAWILPRDSPLKRRFAVIDAVPARALAPLRDAIRARARQRSACSSHTLTENKLRVAGVALTLVCVQGC